MKKTERIFMVAPFKWDDNLYPHLYEFVNNFKENIDFKYIYFRERGYWIENIEINLKRNPFSLRAFKSIAILIIDLVKLLVLRIFIIRKNYKIIAIDNFIYVVCCYIFGERQVYLWSHDFVSSDNPSKKYRSQKIIERLTRQYISRTEFFIIQTDERKRSFLSSIKYDNNKSAFLLPVCLNIAKGVERRNLDKANVKVLQIGGINEFRSNSVSILKNYNSNKYKLCFHGFIADEFLQFVKGSSKKIFYSDSILSPVKLFEKIYLESDIGLVSYNSDNDNFKKIACSSGQFAEFVRANKPILSIGDNTLTDFINDNKIGYGIYDIGLLDSTIDKMIREYEQLSINIQEFRINHFDLKKYTDALFEKFVN